MKCVTNKKVLRALDTYEVGQIFRHKDGALSRLHHRGSVIDGAPYNVYCTVYKLGDGTPEGWLNYEIGFAVDQTVTCEPYRIVEAL